MHSEHDTYITMDSYSENSDADYVIKVTIQENISP